MFVFLFFKVHMLDAICRSLREMLSDEKKLLRTEEVQLMLIGSSRGGTTPGIIEPAGSKHQGEDLNVVLHRQYL